MVERSDNRKYVCSRRLHGCQLTEGSAVMSTASDKFNRGTVKLLKHHFEKLKFVLTSMKTKHDGLVLSPKAILLH